MTRDDITRMAREAGCVDPMVFFGAYERFAALVAAAEREACNKAVYEAWDESGSPDAWRCVKAIRARGQA
jgi:hypothetical protein